MRGQAVKAVALAKTGVNVVEPVGVALLVLFAGVALLLQQARLRERRSGVHRG